MSSENLLSSFKHTGIISNLIRLFSSNADLAGRAVYGIGLRPLTDWDCGFEFRRGHESLSHMSVVYCQVEVFATGWPLVQRSPNVCGVFEYDREALIMRGTWPTTRCCSVTKKKKKISSAMCSNLCVMPNIYENCTKYFRRKPEGKTTWEI